PRAATPGPPTGTSSRRRPAGRSAPSDSPPTPEDLVTNPNQGAPARVDVHLSPADLDAALRADVASGLTAEPPTLPPKWFYDDRGSELFDEITRLDAYYPTR